ncbi:MAG: hypothetical protein ACSNEK_10065 [Parachlamydiaceae bacterium]
MVQILEDRTPTFAQSILGGLAEGIPSAIQQYQQQRQMAEQLQQENQAAKRLGIDLSGIQNPRLREQAFLENLRGRQSERLADQNFRNQLELERYKGGLSAEKLAGQQQEKLAPYYSALNTINRMRELRNTGKLGLLSSYSPLPSTREAAGEYSQLGKSLIQLSTSIPIRNRQEFETLAENLYDPNITDATAKGILNAMEKIIRDSLGQSEVSNESTNQVYAPGIMKHPENKPSLKSFMRRK